MFCEHCGNKIPDESKFCPYCGAATTPITPEDSVNPEDAAPSPALAPAAAPASQEEAATESSPEEKPQDAAPQASGSQDAQNQQVPPQGAAPQSQQVPPQAAAPQSQQVPPQTAAPQSQQVPPQAAAPTPRKPLPKKTVGLIAVIAAAAVAVILIVVLHKPTINLADYVTITCSGYDTVGTAEATFDDDSLYADHQKLFDRYASRYSNLLNGDDDDVEQYLSDLFDSAGPLMLFEDPGSLDKTSDLSNGDTVTYHFDISAADLKKIEKTLNCNVKAEDVTQTVKDLPEIEEVDPFDSMIRVSFSGTAPNGTVDLDVDDELSNVAYVEADPSDGLSNGDTVTVTLTPYDGGDKILLGDGGQVIKTLSKEYTVSGLDAYVTSTDEISDDALKDMNSQAEDVISASWAGNGTAPTKITDLGYYLLTRKKSNGYDYENKFDGVYLVTIDLDSDDKTVTKTFQYYTVVEFYNLISEGDATLVDTSNYYVPATYLSLSIEEEDNWPTTYSCYGYEDLTSLYTSCIATQKADYTITKNLDEDAAAKAKSSDAKKSDTKKESADTDDTEDSLLDQDYIIPDSDSRLLTEDDVKDLTLQEINYAKNEIYARHGRKFKSKELQNY
ncbi:MAG: YARHG domain-containing protein, partial [Lachnospiraceae bacterium]